VHPTGGSRRVFRPFAWLEVGSVKAVLSRPAHPQVTRAVSQPEEVVINMNALDTTQILAFFVVIIVVALGMTDHPSIFRIPSLRFLYRSGLLLYTRTFQVHPQANPSSIPRWKIEHWMVASGFSSPRAEEDGTGRYLLTESVSPLFFPPLPLLLRAKISWDNPEQNVIVHGYSTWSYFSAFALLVVALFIPVKGNGNLCFGLLLSVYVFWCIVVYVIQAQRLHSIGTKVADYLSAGE